jgi:hypothetical protein
MIRLWADQAWFRRSIRTRLNHSRAWDDRKIGAPSNFAKRTISKDIEEDAVSKSSVRRMRAGQPVSQAHGLTRLSWSFAASVRKILTKQPSLGPQSICHNSSNKGLLPTSTTSSFSAKPHCARCCTTLNSILLLLPYSITCLYWGSILSRTLIIKSEM